MSLSPRNSPESLMLAKLPAEVHMWAAAYSLKLIVDDADVETRGLRLVLSDVDNARAFAKLVLDPHAAFRLYKQNMHYFSNEVQRYMINRMNTDTEALWQEINMYKLVILSPRPCRRAVDEAAEAQDAAETMRSSTAGPPARRRRPSWAVQAASRPSSHGVDKWPSRPHQAYVCPNAELLISTERPGGHSGSCGRHSVSWVGQGEPAAPCGLKSARRVPTYYALLARPPRTTCLR